MRDGPVDALNGEREACIERVLALVHLLLFLVKYRQCTRPCPPRAGVGTHAPRGTPCQESAKFRGDPLQSKGWQRTLCP
jgi:hypothetical protein